MPFLLSIKQRESTKEMSVMSEKNKQRMQRTDVVWPISRFWLKWILRVAQLGWTLDFLEVLRQRKNQWKSLHWPEWLEADELEEDKGKRSWTGYQPRVEISETASKYWKFVKSICWSPTSESDMALTSHRIAVTDLRTDKRFNSNFLCS